MNPPHRGFWQVVWQRYRKSRIGMISLVMIAFFVVVAVFAPIIANDKPLIMIDTKLRLPAFFHDKELVTVRDYRAYVLEKKAFAVFPLVSRSPYTTDLYQRFSPPSWDHPMGTDELGRDILARMIHGATVSLTVGIVATLITLVLGVLFGAFAGYYGGIADMLISRLIEVVICFPSFFIILAVISALKPNILNVMVVIGLFGWTGIARLVRAEFLRVKNSEYVEAARVVGAGHASVIFRHILPNVLTPVLISVSFTIASSILIESSLSFLGMGVQPPTASWGQVMEKALSDLTNWWLFIFPGGAIFYTLLGYNLMGETLRDALDVKGGV
ncbi:MAG: ABC transporter permease [Spirochaetes bacterium]|nr:ABC transporter permease [Spirochaetota bacterium]